MQAPKCNCPAAHIGAIACTTRRCLGHVHHAAEHILTLSNEQKRRAIDLAGWDVFERDLVGDGRSTSDDLVAHLTAWAHELRCPHDCDCVCHKHTEACFDEAKRRRDERIAGPVVFLFDRLVRCLVSTADGLQVHALTKLRDALRADADAPEYTIPADARLHGDLGAPPESGIRSTPVACRVEDDQYVYDTLVVGAEWWAVLVDTSEGPTLFAPGALVDDEDEQASAAFDTYVGYVVFVREYGRRSYRCASPDQRETTLRTMRDLCAEARRHEVHRLQQKSTKRRRLSDVPDVRTMIRTPRSVVVGLPRRMVSSATPLDSVYVHLLCAYRARDSRRQQHAVDARTGHLYRLAMPIAATHIAEGRPDEALAVYEAVACEQTRGAAAAAATTNNNNNNRGE